MTKQLLTQEELQQIKGIKEEILNVASSFGELEYQRTIVELEHQRLVDQVKSIKEREQAILKSFGGKYGDGIINLDTGEIDPRS